MKVTFKNVGQGDSIILEWEEFNEPKIGIIDCANAPNDTNPVKVYLENNSHYLSIEFIILSHPHTDHFSGLYDLLGYCEEKKIFIKYFYHTGMFSKECLSSIIEIRNIYLASVLGAYEKQELRKTYKKIYELNRAGEKIIKEINYIQSGTYISIGEKYKLESYSPLPSEEIDKYINGSILNSAGSRKKGRYIVKNNPHANLLSTILSIKPTSSKWQILLFSDATVYSIERIFQKYGIEFFQNVICAQIPHHGSERNHFEIFWNSISNRRNIPILLSVGLGYGHPSKKVVEYFDINYGEIHSTNFVGGFKDYYSQSKKTGSLLMRNNILNMANLKSKASAIANIQACGEKRIIIDNNGKVKIQTQNCFIN